MSVSHSLSLTSTNEARQVASIAGTTLTGSQEINITKLVAAAQTNLLIPISFPVASVLSVVIVADGNCTLKTNSSGSPQETLNITANVPLVWQYQSGSTVPFAGNVTAMYITNTPAVNLRIRILLS